jgi:class 3 adenylate cyclase
MYFGNTNCLLEYDGATWRKIVLPQSSSVRSLAIGEDGTVYVGGAGQIGFLKPDPLGALTYISLLNYIPRADRNFGDVWSIAVTKSGILFGSSDRLFRWSPAKGMKIWRPASRFGRLFVANDEPYIFTYGSGLQRIDGDNLIDVRGGESFAHKKPLRAVLSFAGSLFAITPDHLYRFDGSRFVDFRTSPETLLRDCNIYTATVLRNGTLALGTLERGLLILDSHGALEGVFDKSYGLDSNDVNALYVDRQGGLWLALASGLARMDLGAGMTRFGDREGLPEIVDFIERQGGTLYAGTLVGLSRLQPANHAVAHFDSVPGINGQIWTLLATNGTLLACGQAAGVGGSGLFEVVNGRAQSISGHFDTLYWLAASKIDPGIVYAAGARGLFVLRREGSAWHQVREVPNMGLDFQGLIEDPDGSVWVTTQTQIWRIRWQSDPPLIEQFSSGIPPGFNNIYLVQGEVIFATTKGLLHFDANNRGFYSEPRFGKMFADGSHSVSLIVEGPAGEIWISGNGYHGVLRRTKSGRMEWHENVLARSGIKQLYALHLDASGIVWASGGDGGLVRYDPGTTGANDADFRAIVRRVDTLGGNQILFDGNGAVMHDPSIRHQQNALRFEFAAPSFTDESRSEYEVRLQGLDKSWSPWSTQTQKEYTNLFEGGYKFRVRARDLYGRVSAEDSFAFRILPPWYRTWWAYVLDSILFCGTVWLFIRWRLVRLAAQNRRLEAVIEARTEEIRKQRDAIKVEEEKTGALLLNILPERVAEELLSTGTVKPLACDDITVCFTDFVGFTLSSEKLSAPELVNALHTYFTAFDEIVDRYGLEKLKTIGDSYMFVSGVPVARPSHAVDAVLAALEIVELVKVLGDTGPGWKVRIGLHSGPVVAGVVGVRKFAFDIWGPTVNFASRFESSSWPNHVNLSSHTYELVKDFIECRPRGGVQIKEGRQLQMYFARGVRAELQESFAQAYEQRFGYAPRTIPKLQQSAPSMVEIKD